MNLKIIKLAGFKSFVDPTIIPLPSQLCGIVGPNGCGKSNVVDAIRWVIGESSAKQLRGQSMTDVIFNGSNQRKPVGKASVELVFDNSEGRIGGEFAKFGEIGVRREVHQEGQSNYFLNGTGCRRRDIIDVFLGTGLGPRSYAIIEQGMISQLIEAKPEELRAHLEEAAGISKYKDRRRDTETRIRHTQENLDRLSDLIEELDKQLRHLKRQAHAAERYKDLKQQEHLQNAQIKALQWRNLAQSRQQQEQLILQQKLSVDEQIANLRHVEVGQSRLRQQQIEGQEKLNEVQQTYYSLAAEIARSEQQISHWRQQQQQWQDELNTSQQTWEEIETNSLNYEQQQQLLSEEIIELQPELLASREASAQADDALLHLESELLQEQHSWEKLQRETAEVNQQHEVAKTKYSHYQQQLKNLHNKRQDLSLRQSQLDLEQLVAELEPLKIQAEELNTQLLEIQQSLTLSAEQIQAQRQSNQHIKQALTTHQQSLQQQQQRYASLEALQMAALGQQDNNISSYLQEQQWENCPRLGQVLTVHPGWELAVETVLSAYFDAICLDDLQIVEKLNAISSVNSGQITIISHTQEHATALQCKNFLKSTQEKYSLPSLNSCIETDWPIHDWIAGIYVADSVDIARHMYPQLESGESIITRDGIWLGKHWLRIAKSSKQEIGFLAREQQLRQLQQSILQITQLYEEQTQVLQTGEQELLIMDTQRDQQHQQFQQVSQNMTAVQSKLSSLQSRLTAGQQQQQRLIAEFEECEQQLSITEEQLLHIQQLLESSQQSSEQFTIQQQQRVEQREHSRQQVNIAKQLAERLRKSANETAARLSTNENQLQMVKQILQRDQRQLLQINERRQLLTQNLLNGDAPLQALQESLQEQLEQRLHFETALKQAQTLVNECNQQVDIHNKQWQQLNIMIDDIKQQLQQLQMQHQETIVRQTTIEEQLAETNMILNNLLVALPENIHIADYEQQLEQIVARIARLGPINLAAIEEFQTINERKTFLDKQHTDLVEALDILNNAIRKIDKETRNKFRDTYEQVNISFQQLFPQIFGGGKAELFLAEEDLLTTGIIVKAQPPGKRNASVHLLSGGEKALTAIALIFALFQLNPAPFCILDEVDAPLDDLNVGRFCQLVKQMSKQTQFIVISHNKVTISFAEHLLGVTMQEPGVSRIVSVDMQQAVTMVE